MELPQSRISMDGSEKVMSLKEQEKEYIKEVFKHFGYRKSRTAKALKITRTTLNRKLRQHGLEIIQRNRV